MVGACVTGKWWRCSQSGMRMEIACLSLGRWCTPLGRSLAATYSEKAVPHIILGHEFHCRRPLPLAGTACIKIKKTKNYEIMRSCDMLLLCNISQQCNAVRCIFGMVVTLAKCLPWEGHIWDAITGPLMGHAVIKVIQKVKYMVSIYQNTSSTQPVCGLLCFLGQSNALAMTRLWHAFSHANGRDTYACTKPPKLAMQPIGEITPT